MSAGMKVSWDTKELQKNTAAMMPKLHRGLTAIADRGAGIAQDHMRSTAPWTDRTSNARNGLFAKAFSTPSRHTIVLYHTVPYGIWLEVRWAGKYAVINPTLQAVGPRVMTMVNKLLARL